MKTILVTGDLIWDFNLIRRDVPQRSYGEPVGHTVMARSHGGAWFLEQMVRLALRDVMNEPPPCASGEGSKDKVTLQRLAYDAVGGVQVSGPPWREPQWDAAAGQFAGGAAPAFTVWKQYPRKRKPPEEDEKAWCVTEFLGCQKLSIGAGGAAGADSIGDIESVDVVVLDDLGLGFRMHSGLWPRCVHEGRRNRIVLKLSNLSDKNPLFDHLLEHHAERLTVVVDADELRARGANLSRGLSWELNKQELIQELATGRSQLDLALARRVVVPFALDAVASFTRCDRNLGPPGSDPDRSQPPADGCACDCIRPRAIFERLLYVPDAVEGSFRDSRDGRMFGAASILTAAVARHELSPETYPLFIALGRGMRAAQENHDAGVVVDAPDSPPNRCQVNEERIAAAMHPEWTIKSPAPPDPKSPKKKQARKTEPADAFKTAFPHYVLTNRGQLKGGFQDDASSGLLQDLSGAGAEAITALAMSVVLQGASTALDAAPKARLGHFVTVDREEIERLNALRNLFTTYLDKSEQTRPLSIVVFGQPGSGKSFAVKQLAKVIFRDEPEPLEFNVAQFSLDASQLHGAFHRIRDAAVKGQVPLVFWDEFDCDGLIWLKHFLAPMQDGEFRSGEIVHPFGKCIFVFAGGTAPTLSQFLEDSKKNVRFGELKGPDFVSRLSGYLNVKGPNPNDGKTIDETADRAFIVRRAVLLRSMLERFYKSLIDSASHAHISNGVVRAFLRVASYRHGARSLESVLGMCRLENATFFEPAQLATQELLSLHVSDDFMKIVADGEVEAPVIEAMAEAIHEAWREERDKDDWDFGEQRDDFAKLHPMMKPYAQLSEADKERNRRPARLFRAKLDEVGFTVLFKPGAPETKLDDKVSEFMMRSEHDRWLRERLFYGTQWAPKTCEDLKLHCDVAAFDHLDSREQSLDAKIVAAIPQVLHRFGNTIEPKEAS